MLRKILIIILSIPKTLLFNFYYLPFGAAVKFPILVAFNVRIASLGSRDALKLKNLSFGSVTIGLGEGSFGLSSGKNSFWRIGENATMTFEGKCSIGKGTSIIVGDEADIVFGNNFSCNANCILNAAKKIEFGTGCLLGWNVTMIDGDGHPVFNKENELTNAPRSIKIGNHVWLASESKILKGSYVADNCVVGFASCVSGRWETCNCVLAGNPACIKKQGIFWDERIFSEEEIMRCK